MATGDTDYDVEALRERLVAALKAEGCVELYPARLAEQFPRILAKIVELWGTPELDHYFQRDLLTTDRAHRQGFPEDVAVELFRLSYHHAGLRKEAGSSQEEPEDASPWGLASDAEYFGKSGQ